MAGVFISYRKDDTRPWAIALRDHLARAFGERQVFFDVDSLGAGQWRTQIEDALSRCGAVVVLIGPRWLTATDAAGRVRLSLEDDVHRHEVSSALQRTGTTVIPVLVDGAPLPGLAELPDDLRPLLECQAIALADARGERDASLRRLVEMIDTRLGHRRESRKALVALTVTTIVALVNAVVASRSTAVAMAYLLVAAALATFSGVTYRGMLRDQMKGAWVALVALMLSAGIVVGSLVRLGTA